MQSAVGYRWLCSAGGDTALLFLCVLLDSSQTLQDTFSCNTVHEESSGIKVNSTFKKEAKIHQSEAMTENDRGK